MFTYSVSVNILNYDKWYATCDGCDYRSNNYELLSHLVRDMATHNNEQHPRKPRSVGYPAPPKPSQIGAKYGKAIKV